MSCVVLAAGAARASCPVSRARAAGMRRSPAALLALALLLSATAAAAAQANKTNCTLLADKSADRAANLGQRRVWQKGVASNVTLVWGSEPARAAAALLVVLLRHVRLYRGVRLARVPSPLATANLTAQVPVSPTGEYTDLLIGVSTAWEPAPHTWEPQCGPWAGLAGPRLAEFGASTVPARRRLFAWLAPRVRSHCRGHERWSFYNDRPALATCDFVYAESPQAMVDVLAVGDCNDTWQRLAERANATNTQLNLRFFDRAQFLRALDTANRSFLFLDWDMWQGADGVSVVESPPCVSVDFNCKQELDSTVAIRVADVVILQTYAPHLFQYVHDFNPSPESLRMILKRQASGVDIEEAACGWALDKKSDVVSIKDRRKYDKYQYTVLVYLCLGDVNNGQYNDILGSVSKLIYHTFKNRCDLTFKRSYTYCSEDNDMSDRLNNYTQSTNVYNLVGVVSMTVEGAAAASATAAAANVPLMLADVAPERGSSAAATWRVAGRPRHITRALLRFVRQARWTRLAVLSQNTTDLAADYYSALRDQIMGNDLRVHQFSIPLSLEEQETQKVLQDLRDTNVRIMFINADSQAAVTILNAAAAAGMGYSDGFVWIARDWRQSELECGTKHFTVSFWSRGLEGLPLANIWKPVHEKLKKTLKSVHPWPPRAISLVDALLSLSMGFKDVFQRYPELRQDLRTAQMIRLLKESLMEKPVASVSQLLHYAERSIEETYVFVDQWCGGTFEQRLATWRVNATSGDVRGNYLRPDNLPQYDGTSGCTVQSGDRFDPSCHDAECACALLLLALSPGAILLARRALRRRLARLLHKQQIQMIARRRHVAAVLAAYLVERDALEMCEELGAGRFGCVCLARLRVPGRAPRYIAAKALRDNAAPAEESEFLREACTIASLEHAHIVRLIGVCIADGPPLVLMELAFFGDLLGYLRERRHLVEGTDSDEPAESSEAEHVSAEALTRLAREAAEALQYLSARGVVHRDVRAANCLVDVRRSLKLADFGMARDTVAGADGAPEYACRRRGLFPVLWMAPESLAHGVFSAASDVWALGVLVLELVTLGVRPYGSMSPLRVLEYVAAGGSPPLPLDATPQTRGLARLCWARAAERRPSAAEVAAYLAAWPRALCPALLSQRDEPADADSGFGESPSTELLPPDSPLHSLYQLDDLASTH